MPDATKRSALDYQIAPSVLAADFLRLGDELRDVENAGAHAHHLDVMDGHFVKNLSFGVPLIAAIKKVSTIPLDVHIMVSNPEEVVSWYLDAGADTLNFHIEACKNPKNVIAAIKERKVACGIAVHPDTHPESIFPYLPLIDQVLVMSVVPGFGGQKILPGVSSRIASIYDKLVEIGLNDKVRIAVDGGIHKDNIKPLAQSGARLFVAGSSVYGAKDRKQAVQDLLKAL